MKKLLALCLLAVGLSIVGARPGLAAVATSGTTLLVIPSRYTVVQFAFDVVQKRSMYLVSYDRTATDAGTLLYAWDSAKREWISVTEGDISSGALFNVKPEHVALVGDDRTLPASLVGTIEGIGKPVRIMSLNIVDIANGLDGVLEFTANEWKWFAGRYGFTLTDRNSERRRWGRYGPPGEKSERPAGLDEAIDQVPMPEPAVDEPASAVEEPAPAAQQSLIIPSAAPAGENAPPEEAQIEKVAVPAAVSAPADIAPENK